MTLQATLESRTPAAETASIRQKLEWPGRICILLAVIATPWLFGGVYFSAQFLMALCCMVGIGLLWFESGVSERRSLVLPFLMLPLMIGIFLALLQMVPLGDAFGWLLGKQKELYPLLTGDPTVAPSISMSRSDTWNQAGLLVVAFGSLCLGCRYFRSNAHVKILLIVLTLVGVAISLFGLIQALTTDNSRFIYWTVELVGGGYPFGPYVNRNNAAGLLLICFGASLGLITITFERERRGPKPLGTKDLPFWSQLKNHSLQFIAELDAPKVASLLAPVAIASGIIGSLSRGGVLSLLVAGIATLLLYGIARRPNFSAFVFIPAFLLAILIASWLGFGDKLMDRMDEINTVEVTSQSDIRIEHWRDTWPATKEFGPLGSGVGAYDEVHRIYNRGRTQTVFTYAENQFFQALVELGWPGLILVLASWLLMLYYSLFLLFRGSSASTFGIGVAALFTTVGVAIASFFDFGLYIPANMLMMSLFCGFVAYHAQSLSSRLKKRGWLYRETPNWVAQILFLITFAALSVFALDFWRKWQIQTVSRGEFPHRTFAFDHPDLSETEELIADLRPMVERTRYREGVDYLGRLWIHRSRLQLLDILESGNATEDREQLWQRTSLDMIQENIWALHEDGAFFSADKFAKREFIKENLPEAYKYLKVSRQLDPMDAQTHLMLGQINAIHRRTSVASQDMERVIMLAPNKVDYKYLTGFYYLQIGNSKKAAGHLRSLLENDPRQFAKVMKLIFGGSQRNVAAIDEMMVARDIMPDDPYLLYQVAKKYLTDPAARSLALNRSDKLLADITPDDRKLMITWAEVKFEKQDYSECLRLYDNYLFSRPQDNTIHYRVAQIHMLLGDLDMAEEKLNKINRMTDSTSLKAKSDKLLEQIRQKRKTNGDSEIR